MKHRLLTACAVLSAAALIISLSASLFAQGTSPARLPWGDPDLQGTWTNATLTPLQRSPELGTKAFFTAEEEAVFAKQRREATNADRPLRPGEVGAYNDAFFERGKGGVKSRRTSLIVDPPDGRLPALTPAWQQRVAARLKSAETSPADSWEDRWLTERCILFGATVPMLPEPYNNNYRIEQSPGYVTILVEMNHDTRIIPVDGRGPLSPKIAQWVGDSRGRWEGDTLVVETRNLKFNHQSRFGVGYLNGASDENLRVVERFTRSDANTLTYQATIEDPTVFTRPWTVEIPMDKADGAIYEVACHEGNYGMFNILSGHRAEERAAAGRTGR
jgi:hypothetical protein